ncbi:Helicase required for RNAi-mediated heterochromatin assembly 1 [Ophiocordyceps camponoti-floridani]|uniref:Helicase required for RNAi-mediated heterochromatin assembly 1 n=1 Tax=Ophiocordyceps camponoti-floridani TaxID=2030778 RepID=A0A8H4Q7D4_9HYPO|nr:Helicase required for RNAi-mediated heterochromatin assembly 1 [Ophiocordyceps camponoti-floridani]
MKLFPPTIKRLPVLSVNARPVRQPFVMPLDWMHQRVVPRADELMAPMPPVLPSIGNTSTGKKEEFLGALYHLHRYEATETLRQAVQKHRQDPLSQEGPETLEKYRGVRILAYIVSRLGVACRLSVSSLENAAEKRQEALTPGSLVVLSPENDEFRTKCFVATVAPLPEDLDKDGPPPPKSVVDLFWADPADAVTDPSLKLTMLEPKMGYFEPIRHIMTGLQRAALSEHRLDKYLFQDFKGIKLAQYLRETPDSKVIYSPKAAQLDDSQLEALTVATSRELAIIQGPPGTGKTFTSMVAIETILKTLQTCHMNRMNPSSYIAPIVIAAQTNHAVDQILLKCHDLGIRFARLGGRSESDIVKESSIIKLRERFGAFKDGEEAIEYRELQRRISSALGHQSVKDNLLKAEQLHDYGVITEDQYSSLIQDDEWEMAGTDGRVEDEPCPMTKWIDEYTQQPDFQRARQNCIRNADYSRIPRKKFRNHRFHSMQIDHFETILRTMHRDDDGAWYAKGKRLLSENSDMYKIKPADRGAAYVFLHKSLHTYLADHFRSLVRDVDVNLKGMLENRRMNEYDAIQRGRIEVLGCTTTGLLMHRDLLELVNPRVMLIEEAAETRESSTVAGLIPSVEQLILVGDHQQLTPHTDLIELSRMPHKVDMSLFQRLVNREVDYYTLRVQRRMIPAIREIVQAFYPSLEDHESVNSPERQKPIPGMLDHSVWWFSHSWSEDRGASGFDYSNPKEAWMIVEFTRYLVKCGVSPADITILTYYSAQLELIKRTLAMDSQLGNSEILGIPDFTWSVRTVDDFQGEENEIILLSLVRGSSEAGRLGSIGFVADENRAVVATSRARQGFYIFGDSRNMLHGRGRDVWGRIHQKFCDRTASFVPVVCPTHGRMVLVSQPNDWRQFTLPGCKPGCTMRQEEKSHMMSMTPVRKGGRLASPSKSTKPSNQATKAPPVSAVSSSNVSDSTTQANRYTSDQILEKGMRNVIAAREEGQEASERAMSATSGPTDSSPDPELEDLIKF